MTTLKYPFAFWLLHAVRSMIADAGRFNLNFDTTCYKRTWWCPSLDNFMSSKLGQRKYSVQLISFAQNTLKLSLQNHHFPALLNWISNFTEFYLDNSLQYYISLKHKSIGPQSNMAFGVICHWSACGTFKETSW